MPIATITPLNGTQTSLLAQALNGSANGTLAQALNAAIQRGSDAAARSQRQEEVLINTQQQNISNDLQKDRDKQTRVMELMKYSSNERQNKVQNDINFAENGRAQEKFGFERQDRIMAQELGVTAPEIAQFNKQQFELKAQQEREIANARIGQYKSAADLNGQRFGFEKAGIDQKAQSDAKFKAYSDSMNQVPAEQPDRPKIAGQMFDAMAADPMIAPEQLNRFGFAYGLNKAPYGSSSEKAPAIVDPLKEQTNELKSFSNNKKAQLQNKESEISSLLQDTNAFSRIGAGDLNAEDFLRREIKAVDQYKTKEAYVAAGKLDSRPLTPKEIAARQLAYDKIKEYNGIYFSYDGEDQSKPSDSLRPRNPASPN